MKTFSKNNAKIMNKLQSSPVDGNEDDSNSFTKHGSVL
jgi:hypothetical protein